MNIDKKSLPFVSITSRTDVDPVTKVRHVIEECNLSAFDSKLLAHLADRALHRFTVGIAAPWPEHELLRTIAESIERGESLTLTHEDQFINDWNAAIATDIFLKEPAGTTQISQTDAPSLWVRIGDAWDVLTGKVTI